MSVSLCLGSLYHASVHYLGLNSPSSCRQHSSVILTTISLEEEEEVEGTWLTNRNFTKLMVDLENLGGQSFGPAND